MVNIKKIIIKKQDATTNVILFLFNSFLVPKGITKISLKKLFELMKPFNKSETSIRMGLSRAVKAEILSNIKENDQVYYELIDNGAKSLEEWKEIKQIFWKKISMKKNLWNNYWCVVVMDLVNIKENKENMLEYLKNLGFVKLNKDTFIHPYDFSKDIQTKIDEYNLVGQVKVFISKLVSEHNVSDFVSSHWDINSVNQKYINFTFNYPPTLPIWNGISDAEKIIPFCHNFIGDFTELMKLDPVLPNEFVGANWEGDNVLRILDQFNRTVVPRAKDIVDKILNN
ncbi:MAG: PaaX family transcriptional regulator C-terminal domain-containing protein [Deltaproteobacteria bacterium]